jgi:hypothetical protein
MIVCGPSTISHLPLRVGTLLLSPAINKPVKFRENCERKEMQDAIPSTVPSDNYISYLVLFSAETAVVNTGPCMRELNLLSHLGLGTPLQSTSGQNRPHSVRKISPLLACSTNKRPMVDVTCFGSETSDSVSNRSMLDC